jgi:hypothetical protein
MSTIEELLGTKSSGCGLESENKAIGIRHVDRLALSIANVSTNFADKRPISIYLSLI